MADIQIIQFTQEQVRNITGISSETLRHWRKTIRYLAGKSGKSARYSVSDVVCLAAIAQAINVFGVSISYLGPMVDPLFKRLVEQRPSLLQSQALVLRKREADIIDLDEVPKIGCSSPLLLIPFSPLMENMRQCLLPGLASEVNVQLQIPFSLQSVGK